MWKLFKKKKTKFPCYIHFEEIKLCYQQKCEDFGITPNLRVLQKLKKARIKPRVSLRDLQLDDYQISAFLEVLLLSWTKSQWRTVILTGNQISDITCHFMSHIIEKCRNIEKLDLSNNNISVEGVRLIYEACLRRKSKLILNISKNESIGRMDAKKYMIGCRDLKELDAIVDLQSEQKASEFEEITSMDDDLTTFSPNSEIHTSPGMDLDSSMEAQEIQQDMSFLTTEVIDSSHSMMEATGSRFSVTESQNRSSLASDMISPTSPKQQFQSSHLTRQEPTHPNTKAGSNNESLHTPKPSLLNNSPISRASGNKSKTKPGTSNNKHGSVINQHQVKSEGGTSISQKDNTSIGFSSQNHLSSTPLSPGQNTAYDQSTSDYTSDVNTIHADNVAIQDSSLSSTSIHPNPAIQTIREAGEVKKLSPKQRASVASLFSLGRIFRSSPTAKESPNSEQKKDSISSKTETEIPISMQQNITVSKKTKLLLESNTLSSPRSQHDSLSSQKVHYPPSTAAQNEFSGKTTEPSLAYSPLSPKNGEHVTSPLFQEGIKVNSRSNSLISPLQFPHHNDDSPTELNAVSRDISELSGVDSMTLNHQGYPYDGIDDTDEDIDEVENIINAIGDKDEHIREVENEENQKKSKKKWIRPDIYVYKKRNDNAKLLQMKDEEQLDSRPTPKKVIKRVKQDELKMRHYLLNTFSLQHISQHPDELFQYETPPNQRFYTFNPKNREDTSENILEVPSAIILPINDKKYTRFSSGSQSESQESIANSDDSEEEDDDELSGEDEKVYFINTDEEVLPMKDVLPIPLHSISLRGAKLCSPSFMDSIPDVAFEKLICLDLSFNRIKDLGTVLQPLRNLKILNLRGNKLTSLSGVEFLLKLEQLDVSVNFLQSAAYLENLSMLRVLDISYNHIQSLAGLRMLSMNKALQTLNLEGNHVHLRQETKLRVTLTSLLREHLTVYCHQPSIVTKIKSRAKARDAKVDEIRRRKELPVPTSNNSINITRRISLQERYKTDAEIRKKLKQTKEKQEEKQKLEEKKRVKEAKARFYTKAKWHQLNSVPRLETPRYTSTDELNHDLNSTLKRSSTVLDSILEYSSPQVSILQRLAISPRLSSSRMNASNRSQKLYNAVSKDFGELLNRSIDKEEVSDSWIISEVQEDLHATYMAFSTLTDYVNRNASYLEFLDLQKLLEDCSLFDPVRIDSSRRSTSIQAYVQKANQAKVKLQKLFKSYLESIEAESVGVQSNFLQTLEESKKEFFIHSEHEFQKQDTLQFIESATDQSYILPNAPTHVILDNVHGSIDD